MGVGGGVLGCCGVKGFAGLDIGLVRFGFGGLREGFGVQHVLFWQSLRTAGFRVRAFAGPPQFLELPHFPDVVDLLGAMLGMDMKSKSNTVDAHSCCFSRHGRTNSLKASAPDKADEGLGFGVFFSF